MLSSPRKSLRDKKGFTLIELLVVIVIIGILAAVAFPLYQNLTKNAADASAKGALAALRGASALYYGQYGTYAPDLATVEGQAKAQGGITYTANGISVAAGGTTYTYTLSYDSTDGTISCTSAGTGTSCSSW
ncbi:prepilin-type N-terminal cleavage/methylation domain-containing protein [Thermodesulfobium acidiphilum]|uniref:Prepilin-type N-terminal cleavage/methylation domain-containing protein n=1 Tax=Thermodesulfobium acidiphilum TaxID=1794699 RepID=A0A2R4VYZ1_THEAF|nr:prepilin-type N-terminal cleavage/methylation domain-containing protein [Thermodesulfobium acidiphilum]AWB09684.1 prepilin-type N-terminal cleavage/methylation domain-containing protein [Thermodesulfobium acidiphilum]